MNIVFLGIGTNSGNREENLKNAVDGIKERIGSVIKSSSVYETEPWGFMTDDQFLNMVVEVETELSPLSLLPEINNTETLLGRIRDKKQYVSRIIDIDILFYEDLIIDECSLKIPHPLMHKRRFVLVPLCEIAPEMIHPVLKMSCTSLLESCKDESKVKLFRQSDIPL